MLKRLRIKHSILYCLLAELLFLAVMMLGVQLFSVALLVAGPEWLLRLFVQEPYLGNIVQELIGTAVALFLLWRSGRLGLITRRGCGFLDGLLVGMFSFVLVCYAFCVNLVLTPLPEGATLKPAWQIVAFLLAMLLIGVAEEFLFRGVIAETLLVHFGPSRAGIWKACLLSGVFFGMAHLINMAASEPLGVLIQCGVTAALGVLYTAIYYRTGNLWVPVFLHTMQDTAALLVSGLYGTTSLEEVVSGYDPTMLIGMLFYLLPVLFLLRKSRLPDVAAFCELDAAPPAGEGQSGPAPSL